MTEETATISLQRLKVLESAEKALKHSKRYFSHGNSWYELYVPLDHTEAMKYLIDHIHKLEERTEYFRSELMKKK